MEKITNDLADKLKAWLEGDDVKSAIEATKQAPDSDTGTFEVVITTENLDRYQEVIALDGWELEHYRKNPVVLWGHDHNNLVAVCTTLEIVDGKLVAKGKFAPTEEGQEKRKLYDEGFLRATSVGFIEKEREGNLITKAELLEFSFVSVPANPYALSLAMEKGYQVNELVTKGILSLKEVETDEEKETEADETEENDQNDEEPVVEASIEDLHTAVKELQISVLELADALKSSVLEDGDSTTEPEDTEEPETDETEDEKKYREFSDKRKLVQSAATILGDVLAEARQAIEVQK